MNIPVDMHYKLRSRVVTTALDFPTKCWPKSQGGGHSPPGPSTISITYMSANILDLVMKHLIPD